MVQKDTDLDHEIREVGEWSRFQKRYLFAMSMIWCLGAAEICQHPFTVLEPKFVYCTSHCHLADKGKTHRNLAEGLPKVDHVKTFDDIGKFLQWSKWDDPNDAEATEATEKKEGENASTAVNGIMNKTANLSPSMSAPTKRAMTGDPTETMTDDPTAKGTTGTSPITNASSATTNSMTTPIPSTSLPANTAVSAATIPTTTLTTSTSVGPISSGTSFATTKKPKSTTKHELIPYRDIPCDSARHTTEFYDLEGDTAFHRRITSDPHIDDMIFHYYYVHPSKSLIGTFDLTCDRGSYVPLTGFLFFLGFLFGCVLLPRLADRMGRKPWLYISISIHQIASTGIVFSKSIVGYCFCRFLLGFSIGGTGNISFMMLAEVLPTAKRHLQTLSMNTSFVLGAIGMCILSYLFQKSWRTVSTILCILSYSFLFLGKLPLIESAKWLYAKKKMAKLKSVLRTMALVNGRLDYVPFKQKPTYNLPTEGESTGKIEDEDDDIFCIGDQDEEESSAMEDTINGGDGNTIETFGGYDDSNNTTLALPFPNAGNCLGNDSTQVVGVPISNEISNPFSPGVTRNGAIVPSKTDTHRNTHQRDTHQSGIAQGTVVLGPGVLGPGVLAQSDENIQQMLSKEELSKSSNSLGNSGIAQTRSQSASTIGSAMEDEKAQGGTKKRKRRKASPGTNSGISSKEDDIVEVSIASNTTRRPVDITGIKSPFTPSGHSKSLFKHPILKPWIWLIMFLWFAATFGYYGVAYNVENLSQDHVTKKHQKSIQEISPERSKSNKMGDAADGLQGSDKVEKRRRSLMSGCTLSGCTSGFTFGVGDFITPVYGYLMDYYSTQEKDRYLSSQKEEYHNHFRFLSVSDDLSDDSDVYGIAIQAYLMEIPSYVLASRLPEIAFFGRKGTLISCFFLGGLLVTGSGVLQGLVQIFGSGEQNSSTTNASTAGEESATKSGTTKSLDDDSSYSNATNSGLCYTILYMALIGRFFVAVAFGALTLYTVEVFPTEIRGSALGWAGFATRTGGVLLSYVVRLDSFLFSGSPLIIFGLPCVLSSLWIRRTLPETRGKKLLDTIAELEKDVLETRRGNYESVSPSMIGHQGNQVVSNQAVSPG